MNIRRWTWVPVVAFGFACVTFVQGDQKKPDPFAAVVESHFAAWDTDHDGKVSTKEIDALVTNHKITGDEAAAIAAIHLYMRGHKETSLSKADLLKSPAKPTEERRDQPQHQAHFTSNFLGFRTHIHKAPKEIFATKDAPTLNGFSQGNLGDCYFLSVVAAAVHRDAAAVKHMFQTKAGETNCEVHFPNGKRASVSKPTDAEIALSSSAGDQGLWLNVLEKAFGEVKIATSKSKSDTLGLDAISHGGDADCTISLMTGHESKYFQIRKGKGEERPAPAADAIPALKKEVHDILSTAMHAKHLVCCGTSKGNHAPGIITDHDYAILDYDAKKQVVTVMNPWGNHFEPKGENGLKNGYTTKNGKFDVPIADFVSIFEGVYYETANPAKKKK